jgi:hypothetical protein
MVNPGIGEKIILAIFVFTVIKRFFGGYISALLVAVGLGLQF